MVVLYTATALRAVFTYRCYGTLCRTIQSVYVFRTSPSSSLCVLAKEPPFYIRRRKLLASVLLSSPRNHTYNTV